MPPHRDRTAWPCRPRCPRRPVPLPLRPSAGKARPAPSGPRPVDPLPEAQVLPDTSRATLVAPLWSRTSVLLISVGSILANFVTPPVRKASNMGSCAREPQHSEAVMNILDAILNHQDG